MSEIEFVFEERLGGDAPEHVFVEIEDGNGHGIEFGEWIKRPDGFVAIRSKFYTQSEYDAHEKAKAEQIAAEMRGLREAIDNYKLLNRELEGSIATISSRVRRETVEKVRQYHYAQLSKTFGKRALERKGVEALHREKDWPCEFCQFLVAIADGNDAQEQEKG